MIKAEVVFDGDVIYCNGFSIVKGWVYHFIENNNGEIVEDGVSLEQAIKYCLEN